MCMNLTWIVGYFIYLFFKFVQWTFRWAMLGLGIQEVRVRNWKCWVSHVEMSWIYICGNAINKATVNTLMYQNQCAISLRTEIIKVTIYLISLMYVESVFQLSFINDFVYVNQKTVFFSTTKRMVALLPRVFSNCPHCIVTNTITAKLNCLGLAVIKKYVIHSIPRWHFYTWFYFLNK